MPGSLSTPILPATDSTRRLATERPTPAPCGVSAGFVLSLVNDSKMADCICVGIPGPVSVIGEAHAGPACGVALGIERDLDIAALGEADGVAGDLQQYAPQKAGIASDPRQSGRDIDGQTKTPFPRVRLEQPRHRPRRLGGIAALDRERHRLVRLVSQRDDVVEQRLQSAACFQQHLDVIALRLLELAAFQELRHAEDRVERCAQLLADIRDEGRFGAFAGLRVVARGFGGCLFFVEADDQMRVVTSQDDGLFEQLTDRPAIGVEHTAEEEHEQRPKGSDRPEVRARAQASRARERHARDRPAGRRSARRTRPRSCRGRRARDTSRP